MTGVCTRGHDRAVEWDRIFQRCRACRRVIQRAYTARKRSGQAAPRSWRAPGATACPDGHAVATYGMRRVRLDLRGYRTRRTALECRRCERLRRQVARLRTRPTLPATSDAALWRRFRREIEARIALIRQEEGFDSRLDDLTALRRAS
jgi:hypothetical protein